MLYQAYQAHSDIMVPVRSWATAALRAFGQPLAGIADNAVLRNLSAAYELIARTGLTHARPAFGIDSVTIGNREVAVDEEAALTTPFGTLLHFKKDVDTPQPRVLLVAPLSGHFSTLLRGTVRTMLLTVEGERDDICAVGQTAAAHDLCTGLRPYLKRHHMQTGVGHYGVFSGNRWTNQIYPLVKNVILASE
jgi:poly-beta-hydroxyalkanoate depolymerase